MAKFKGTAAANTIYGTALADTLDGGTGADTLVGGLGNDTYFIDNIDDVIVETNATAAGGIDTIISSIDINADSPSKKLNNIENITLTGTDDLVVIGNKLNNKILGNAGNNTISGFAGNDTIFGGAGDDSLYATDNVFLSSNSLENNLLDGGDGNDTLVGFYGSNTLIGGNGNDILYAAVGTNVLNGGGGDDTYYLRNFNSEIFSPPAFAAKVAIKNTVTEAFNGGTDAINIDFDGGPNANFAYTLVANVEILDASVTVGTNLALTGNLLDNNMIGGGLNDTLNGGLGVDSLAGGLGDDTYVVDNTLDIVTEALDEGIDTITLSRTAGINTYFLDDNVENIVLTNKISYNVTGNALDNEITGNAADNALYGENGNDQIFGGGGSDYLEGDAGGDYLDGGIGADRYNGGLGDDTYVYDNAGDAIQTADTGGIDTIIASTGVIANGFNVLDLTLDTVLTKHLEIENVSLTGKLNILVTGNSLDNNIFGNEGKNDINGFDGNDYIDGDAGNDKLVGNSGNDTLIGGLGNDTLQGGAGDDVFVFDSTLSATTNVDIIKDFQGTDIIQLDNDIFTSLGNSNFLDPISFVIVTTGSSGDDENDYIIYNSDTQSLYYDADGAGGLASIKFATLEGFAGGLSDSYFSVV